MLESGVAPMSTESVTGLTQRLYHEARLLDAERFEDWLEFMCNDVTYRMELKRRRFRADRSPPAAVGVGVVFNENLARLKLRIDRLRSGFVWAEDPPNFVRRVVSNVEVERADAENEAIVHSVIVIHRNRIDGLTRVLTAGRSDRWRMHADGWKLAAREIALDHAVLPDSNINVFF
ncbi:aromatic-ring-hydroxylating dioxygenase subunit beta [Sphingobium sp. AR-3-1]|uniref:Aromatic-ring-hydroxylating dioxygenase subunit beta n=1 Tax=Sphingobium psychrophilum TaxID=2728834 RepID=A0A7X9X0I1_9SPHN|nr:MULTISPECIES: aromatic-ring-hydroxylating dioxygenase subunit beta [Sphingobium]MBV2148241.1 aromatic-ring-hydroxylating dioxygenase subunit beta [Sphingobium sp. AS12]NML13321.1 aromatic-ring-hydroxylating dioxygenase subunit beta [Sphingobium psychrophilum]PBN41582.1 aromatic-ring-hydroxylating dioxygenase subunit beta [Sphingobium sp. D43FB]